MTSHPTSSPAHTTGASSTPPAGGGVAVPLATPDDLYPPAVRQHWRDRGVWTDDTLAQHLSQAAARFAERPAVVAPIAATPGAWARLSYADLDAYAEEVACLLVQQGVRPGDRVVVFCPNTVEYFGAFFGVVRLGAVPVHALPAHGVTELEHFLSAAGARAILTVERFGLTQHAALAREAAAAAGADPQVLLVPAPGARPASTPVPPADVDPHGLGLVQLSGGTTGVPKLIGRSHADYLFSVRRSVEVCELSPDTRMLVVLPAAHNFTMSSPGILGVTFAGGCLVCAPDPTPGTAFRLIEEERITMAALVPPLAMLWLNTSTERDLSSLEVLQVGGAKFANTAAAQVRDTLGCTLQQVFGMAEGLVNYTRLDDPEELITTTQGYPMSEHDEVLVLDDAGEPVAPGEVGNLWTRGPYTIRGYLGGVSASSFDEQGFYCTGDLVRQLPSGHLVVEGRAKEQINRAGEKISCEELEDLLLQMGGVADALVLGLPDEHLGEKTCAVLIPADPAAAEGRAEFTLAGVRDFLQQQGVAAFKLPDQVVVRTSFPTTTVGKASRASTRRRLQQEHAAQA
ncbi:2,3-dihydroxybenzoate-AMP ligase [Corynebacterium sp. 13CS0277]|uniref:(2,3-dihydroxybenzoyl)adenylate synthase n=1 Tax=Corynebacterium sp. 13CS0277 TaxID=2071994 RepID=UPI000D043BAA|nr:AMP-binding protein [Corynebacterium sp. 13CS0277]PRQ12381.1 2,3-dihydroxybenzoate-AMP ligase [Corynebacterium sp. 13CS0277]